MNKSLLAIGSALFVFSSQLFAQQAVPWPVKPTRLITNYTPGGPTDLVARTMAVKMQEKTGAIFIVDNLPGANGVIGTQATARSDPDGHTIMLSTAGHTAIAAALYGDKLPFDPFHDLTPISMLVLSNQLIFVNAELGVKSIAELIKLAKSMPGKLNYGTPGVGTPNHLGLELLKSTTGIDMLHVPYKGSAAMIQDLLANRIQVMINSAATVGSHVQAGKLVPLASGWTSRAHALPDVPTMQELGFSDYKVSTWFALFAPGKTPPAVVNKISVLTNEIIGDAQTREILIKAGFDPGASTPQYVADLMSEEFTRWKKVIAEAKIVAR